MLKKPWICPACRSTASTRVAPAAVSRSATSLAEIGVRGLTLRSCRAYPKYGINATMEPADARLRASIMMSSSIRLRFGGLQVDCMMKQLTPRTFSPISTKISPSENRSTRERPTTMPSCSHSSVVNGTLELPPNMVSVLFTGSSGVERKGAAVSLGRLGR
jgi:hypothetical protein